MLTASTVASLAGPIALAQMRNQSEMSAIHDLAASVSSEDFQNAFGASKSHIDSLVETKL
eukprot:UN15519